MKELEDRIRRDGRVLAGGILKVDDFLNVRIDPVLMDHIGKEFARLFEKDKVTMVLTIEASGIAPAYSTALALDVPLVFAKKARSANLGQGDVYSARVRSFTYGRDYDILVPSRFITSADRVLIIDDFLANGFAARGLNEIIHEAGAETAGVGVCIAKCFQPGMKLLEEECLHVEALAAIEAMDENGIVFREMKSGEEK